MLCSILPLFTLLLIALPPISAQPVKTEELWIDRCTKNFILSSGVGWKDVAIYHLRGNAYDKAIHRFISSDSITIDWIKRELDNRGCAALLPRVLDLIDSADRQHRLPGIDTPNVRMHHDLLFALNMLTSILAESHSKRPKELYIVVTGAPHDPRLVTLIAKGSGSQYPLYGGDLTRHLGLREMDVAYLLKTITMSSPDLVPVLTAEIPEQLNRAWSRVDDSARAVRLIHRGELVCEADNSIRVIELGEEFRRVLLAYDRQVDQPGIKAIESCHLWLFDEPLADPSRLALQVMAEDTGATFHEFRRRLARTIQMDDPEDLDSGDCAVIYHHSRQIVLRRLKAPSRFYLAVSGESSQPRIIALLGIARATDGADQLYQGDRLTILLSGAESGLYERLLKSIRYDLCNLREVAIDLDRSH